MILAHIAIKSFDLVAAMTAGGPGYSRGSARTTARSRSMHRWRWRSARHTVALNNLVNTSTGAKEYNVDMAAAMIAGLPTLLVYVIAGKYFVRGLTAGAVKG